VAEGPTRANWLDPPYRRQAFRTLDRLLPTATIGRGERPVRELGAPTGEDGDLDAIVYDGAAGPTTVGSWIAASVTDGLCVLAGDGLVIERYRDGFEASQRHLLMSVSKSIGGITALALIADGTLDPSMPVVELIPELAGGGYGEATVQHVLDMAVDLRFSQDYDDPASDVQTEDRASGWRPPLPGDPLTTQAFLATLTVAGPPGRRFRYCSTTTDVLAWLLERASGQPYATVVSERVWSRIGAERDAVVTVDAAGFAYACAGISATLRDLARFGRMVLDGGRCGDAVVVPADAVAGLRKGGTRVDSAEDRDALVTAYPEIGYRDQWWSTRGPRDAWFAVGIFGQWLWLDPTSDVVIAKLSSLDAAYDPADAIEAIHALDAISRSLA